VIFLHNETGGPLEYRIKAKALRNRKESLDESGVLASREVVEALHYFSDSITRVDLEIKQLGSVRTRSFIGSELPASLNNASSGGVWSHIKVQEKSFVAGVGSGNRFPDFQHSFGLMWIPCVGFVVILGSILVISTLVKKSKEIPRKRD
jgi:hypothetical protein